MLRQEELIGGLIKEWSLDSLSRSQRATGSDVKNDVYNRANKDEAFKKRVNIL